jgi:hypothetical protein
LGILSSLLRKFFPSPSCAVDQAGAGLSGAPADAQAQVEQQRDGIAPATEEALTWRVPTSWTL